MPSDSFYYYYYYYYYYSVLRPFQDYFSSYETGQSLGVAKTGEPREKPPGTPASRTWLVSHVARAGLEPTPDTAVRICYLSSENKGADQLRGYREADLRLCFRLCKLLVFLMRRLIYHWLTDYFLLNQLTAQKILACSSQTIHLSIHTSIVLLTWLFYLVVITSECWIEVPLNGDNVPT